MCAPYLISGRYVATDANVTAMSAAHEGDGRLRATTPASQTAHHGYGVGKTAHSASTAADAPSRRRTKQHARIPSVSTAPRIRKPAGAVPSATSPSAEKRRSFGPPPA